MSYIIIILTVIITLGQAAFFLIMHNNYRKVKQELITPNDLRKLLKEYIEKDEEQDETKQVRWVKNLVWTIGRQISLKEIKEIIQSRYSDALHTIRLIGNLGPATGLLSTFLGLFFTLLSISSNPENIVIQETVGGLYPLIIGSALGIIVYAGGNILNRRALAISSEKEAEYMDVYFQVDEEYSINKIRNVKDVYESLFKPLNEIVFKFNTINRNFNEFNTRFAANIDNHDRQFSNYISYFDSKIKNYLDEMEGKITDVNHLFVSISKELNTHTEKNINDSREFLDNLRTTFHKNIDTYDEKFLDTVNRINAQIVGYLEKEEKKISCIGDTLTGISLEIETHSKQNITTSGNLLQEIKSSFEKNINDYQQKTLTMVNGLQSEMAAYLTQMDQKLSSIGNLFNEASQEVTNHTKQNIAASADITNNIKTSFEESIKSYHQTTSSVVTGIQTEIQGYFHHVDQALSQIAEAFKGIRGEIQANVHQNISISETVLKGIKSLFDENMKQYQEKTVAAVDNIHKRFGDNMTLLEEKLSNIGDTFLKTSRDINNHYQANLKDHDEFLTKVKGTFENHAQSYDQKFLEYLNRFHTEIVVLLGKTGEQLSNVCGSFVESSRQFNNQVEKNITVSDDLLEGFIKVFDDHIKDYNNSLTQHIHQLGANLQEYFKKMDERVTSSVTAFIDLGGEMKKNEEGNITAAEKLTMTIENQRTQFNTSVEEISIKQNPDKLPENIVAEVVEDKKINHSFEKSSPLSPTPNKYWAANPTQSEKQESSPELKSDHPQPVEKEENKTWTKEAVTDIRKTSDEKKGEEKKGEELELKLKIEKTLQEEISGEESMEKPSITEPREKEEQQGQENYRGLRDLARKATGMFKFGFGKKEKRE